MNAFLHEARQIMGLVLGMVGVFFFAYHNVADAIFCLALAIWVEPK